MGRGGGKGRKRDKKKSGDSVDFGAPYTLMMASNATFHFGN